MERVEELLKRKLKESKPGKKVKTIIQFDPREREKLVSLLKEMGIPIERDFIVLDMFLVSLSEKEIEALLANTETTTFHYAEREIKATEEENGGSK